MKKNPIEKMLSAEAEQTFPDLKQTIKSRLLFCNARRAARVKPFFRRFAYLAAPLSAMIVIAFAVAMFMIPALGGEGSKSPPVTPYSESVVRLDINPSVKFNVDGDGEILRQSPCNEDGAVLLLKRDFVGQHIEKATAEVVNLAFRYGYLTDTHGREIKLRVLSDDADFERGLMTKVGYSVRKEMQQLCPAVKCVEKGKTDMVEYLVENYDDLEKSDVAALTAMEIEAVFEIKEGESDENIGHFETELAEGMKSYLKNCAVGAEEIKILIEEKLPQNGIFFFNDEEKERIDSFFTTYAVELDETNLDDMTAQGRERWLTGLKRISTDAAVSLDEFVKDNAPISSVLEKWCDRYKIYLCNIAKNA